jgi:hypothetical protein
MGGWPVLLLAAADYPLVVRTRDSRLRPSSCSFLRSILIARLIELLIGEDLLGLLDISRSSSLM